MARRKPDERVSYFPGMLKSEKEFDTYTWAVNKNGHAVVYRLGPDGKYDTFCAGDAAEMMRSIIEHDGKHKVVSGVHPSVFFKGYTPSSTTWDDVLAVLNSGKRDAAYKYARTAWVVLNVSDVSHPIRRTWDKPETWYLKKKEEEI